MIRLFVLFSLIPTVAFSQYSIPVQEPANTIGYMEILGATGFFSINIDTEIAEDQYFRMGVSYLPQQDVYGQYETTDEDFPLLLIVGSYHQWPIFENAYLEGGVGVVLGNTEATSLIFSPPALTILTGIRWDFEDTKLPLLGISLNPVFAKSGVYLVPGIKLGMRF